MNIVIDKDEYGLFIVARNPIGLRRREIDDNFLDTIRSWAFFTWDKDPEMKLYKYSFILDNSSSKNYVDKKIVGFVINHDYNK